MGNRVRVQEGEKPLRLLIFLEEEIFGSLYLFETKDKREQIQ